MSRQASFLKLITVNTLSLTFNALNVYARSIDVEDHSESSNSMFLLYYY